MSTVTDQYRDHPGGIREYRVRRADTTQASVHAAVAGDASITVVVGDGQRLVLDVVTARAVTMLLTEVVYHALQPEGPWLFLEHLTDTGVWAGASAGH